MYPTDGEVQQLVAGDVTGAVVSYIHRSDWVTFIELQQLLAPYLPVEGDISIGLADKNIWWWGGMSEEFTRLIEKLLDAKQVFLHPAHLLTYIIDGGTLSLPLAKSSRIYKKPHWAPACLRLCPFPEKSPCPPIKPKSKRSAGKSSRSLTMASSA